MTVSHIHLAKLKRDRLLELQVFRMRANQAVSQMTQNVSELLDELDIQFMETVAGWDRLNRLNEENKRECTNNDVAASVPFPQNNLCRSHGS
jgi:hypothetical protein